MDIVLYVVIIAAIILLLIDVNFKLKGKKENINNVDLNNLPYKLKYILTKNEYNFYKELKKYTDKNNLLICPKVGLKIYLI